MYTQAKLKQFAVIFPALNTEEFTTLTDNGAVTRAINTELTKVLPKGTNLWADEFEVLENLNELTNGTGYFDGIKRRSLAKTTDNRFHITLYLAMDENSRLVIAFDLGKLGSGCVFQRYTRGERGIWMSNLPQELNTLYPSSLQASDITALLSGNVRESFSSATSASEKRIYQKTIALLAGLGHHQAVWDLMLDDNSLIMYNPDNKGGPLVIACRRFTKPVVRALNNLGKQKEYFVLNEINDVIDLQHSLSEGNVYKYIIMDDDTRFDLEKAQKITSLLDMVGTSQLMRLKY